MKNRRITKIIAIIAVVAMLASFFAINVTADETTIAASGYAAIGIVDADAHKAEVLLGTGEQGTVFYNGDAPTTGGVYRYTRDENNLYTFYTPDANFGNSSLTDASKGCWGSYTSGNGYMWNWNGAENLFFWSVNSPVFLRTSMTEWMVGTNACFVEGVMVASYYLDITENATGHPHYNVSAFVFGGLNADGTIDTVGFDSLKLPETKHDMSSFTTPLHPVAEPEVTAGPLTDGMKVVIYNPKHMKALSSQPAAPGSYYQKGIDVVLADGVLSGFADTEVWTVVANDDGTFSFQMNGQNLGMDTGYASMGLGKVNDDWTVIDLGDGLYLIKNVKRGNYMEWYASKNNWSTYGSSSAATDPLFQLAFFEVKETVEEPTEPEVTEPEVTEPEVTEPEVTEPEVTEPEVTEPEVTEPEATEPEATEPESNGYTASGNVVETGYAAIGVIDETLSKVQVLLSNGKVGAVYYAGEAPKTGAVYGYELHSNNVFVFIEKTGNLGNSDQLAPNSGWETWFEANGWAWDAASPNDIWHMADVESHSTDFRPIFLRFGDNKWVLTTIDKVIAPAGSAYAYGYALDTVSLGDIGNGLNNHTTGALVLGRLLEDGSIDKLGFDTLFGLTAGDVDLGAFTSDLYTPSAKTGDASPIVAIVVAALFSVGAIGFIVSKKKEF